MRKVLIIAYYFPPLGWSGVQRTLKFIKYLRNYNWEPIVVTVGESKFSIKDKSLFDEIPNDIKVIRIDDIKLKDMTDDMIEKLKQQISLTTSILSDKIRAEYFDKIEEKFNEIRNLILIPDGNTIWANKVIRELYEYIDLQEIDLIYTTSAPYSTHLIGYYLKNENNNIPWITDFRDEWVNNACYMKADKNINYKIESYMEAKIVEKCDKIITTTPYATNNFIKRYKIDSGKVITITNGYDEEDFTDIQCHQYDKFTVIHNGTFYLDRSPVTFLIALNNLLEKKLIDKEKIQIIFVGENNQNIMDEARKIINKYNILKEIEYSPHKESLKLLLGAHLLLLVVGECESQKSIYPGKVFEYLRARKSILAISPHDSCVENLLIETEAGVNNEYRDIRGLEKNILFYYNKWCCDQEVENMNDISMYERKYLTKKLSDLFNEICIKNKRTNRGE